MVDVILGDQFIHRREVALVDLFVKVSDNCLVCLSRHAPPPRWLAYCPLRVIRQRGLLRSHCHPAYGEAQGVARHGQLKGHSRTLGPGSSSLLRHGEPIAGSGGDELERANGRPAASRYLLAKIADGEIAEVFFFE